jgi:hypothetical protein
MTLDCIAGGWKQLKRRVRRRWRGPSEQDLAIEVTVEASRKQLADWAAGQHDADPIHK